MTEALNTMLGYFGEKHSIDAILLFSCALLALYIEQYGYMIKEEMQVALNELARRIVSENG